MLYGAMNFPVKPILEEIAEFSMLGFDYLELTMDPPQAHWRDVLLQKNDLLESLKRRDMKLVCHMPTFVSLADLTESIRKASLEEVIRSLETAAELNCLKVVAHPAYISGMGSYVMDHSRELALDSLEAMVAKATELGLMMCLENMFPRTGFGVEVEDFVEIFNSFPQLMMTLDTGHGNIGSPRSKRLVNLIDRFGDRIRHVHISDNFGKEDNHLPVGSGSVRFPKLIEALKKTGFDGTATFEIFTGDREYLRISRNKFNTMWAS